jgi:hypothetical protein
MKALMKDFEGVGFKPESRTLASFQDDYGLEALDGEDPADDEDDEEGDDVEDEESEDEEESEGELEGATICAPRG